jgi:predicted metal-binding protein
VRQERLGQQLLERLQEQRQRQGLQERLEQQQLERLQEQRLLLFCRKRSKQQRPTMRRTKRIWSW